jgi:PST family polysaccharide transporter
VVPLQALALYAGFRALGAGAVDLYKGVGRPGLAAAVSLVRLATLAPALVLAAHVGIDAVAWTQAALAAVFAVGMQSVALRVIGLSAADLAGALRPALAIALGTAAGAGLARWLVPGTDDVRLVASILFGAALGLAAVWLADAQFVREARALLRRRTGSAAVAAA